MTPTNYDNYLEQSTQNLGKEKISITELSQQIEDTIKFCSINAPNIDQCGLFPIKEMELIANTGLLTAPLSKSHGGAGLGFKSSSLYKLFILLKKIGRANLSVGRIYEGHVNALQLLQTFGTSSQIAE